MSRSWLAILFAAVFVPGSIAYIHARDGGGVGGDPGQQQQCCYYSYRGELTGNAGCADPGPQNQVREIPANSIEDCQNNVIEYVGVCAYYDGYAGFGPCDDTAG